MNKKEKPLLEVLKGKKPERMPIWLMRQAGRYLPEYRELRAKAGNFLDLCLTPALAGEVTLQPVRRFGFDAAILFADILLIPYALGVKLEFREGEGPELQTVDDEKAIARLAYDDKRLAPVYETLALIKGKLARETALIGFCGAPWTVACYMIDGDSRAQFARAQSWAAERPDSLERLINVLVDASATYLTRQIEAGAEIVQIFDSWAGLLAAEDFRRWVIAPTKALIARVKKKHPHIPIIGFPREAGAGYNAYIRETGVDALSIDPAVDLDTAKRELQSVKPLQGNLAPELLLKGGSAMKDALAAIIDKLGPTHVLNLGHGVLPQTPLEHVAELVAFVRGYKGP